MSQDYASWSIKDEAILDELVNLMGLSGEDIGLMRELTEHARTIAPKMTAAFYKRLLQHDNTAAYLRNRNIEGLHATLTDWFVDLFSGQYDRDYAKRRLAIGYTHVRIGLPVRYPLAMLDVIMPFGEAITRQSTNPVQALATFRKVLSLDIAVFNQAYEDEHLRHLAELVGGERLARRLMSGEV